MGQTALRLGDDYEFSVATLTKNQLGITNTVIFSELILNFFLRYLITTAKKQVTKEWPKGVSNLLMKQN